MTDAYLWDDARARHFAPFALTRPAGELRTGALLGRERWERVCGGPAAGFVAAAHLRDFDEAGAPAWAEVVPAGALIVNARCLPALEARLDRDATAWRCDGRIAAVRAPRDVAAAELDEDDALDRLAEGAEPAELAGRWVEELWDLVTLLPALIADDVRALAPGLELSGAPAGTVVLGDGGVYVESGATIEPFVVLDATVGPILVRRRATVAAFTRLVGPCVVGEHAAILGGRICAASVGPWCKVAGEVSHSVFHSYANKSHEGFVGHSLVGRWANLGAGTTTSNLKNNYNPVAIWTPDGVRNTGQQFLGTMFGDHAKTAIGTRLNTGTVVGAGANVFGVASPGKVVPPFAWGTEGGIGSYALGRFAAAAERAMARRQVPLTERARRQLAAAHAQAAGG